MEASFDNYVGPLLLGQMISTFLYGLSTLQTYIYFTRFPNDGREIKAWVSTIWVVDTANIVLVCHGLYAVSNGINMPHMGKYDIHVGTRSYDIASGLNIVVAVLVQGFFVKRVCQLCVGWAKYWISVSLAFLVLVHFSLGSAAIVRVVHAFEEKDADDNKKAMSALMLTAVLPYTLAAVVSDLSLSVALIVLFRDRRSDFSSVNSVINRAINFLVTRCVVVSVAAILRLVTFAAWPSTAYTVAVDCIMGKLYANTLLAMLNGRSCPRCTCDNTPRESAVISSVVSVSNIGPSSSSVLEVRTASAANSLREIPDSERDEDREKMSFDSCSIHS